MSQFKKEICVKIDEDHYPRIVGEKKRLDLLDAADGEKIAIYKLVEIKTFHINPRLQ